MAETEQIEVHYRRPFEVTRGTECNLRIIQSAWKSTSKRKNPQADVSAFLKNLQMQVRNFRLNPEENENAVAH